MDSSAGDRSTRNGCEREEEEEKKKKKKKKKKTEARN
jgi:hypothetical protein